MGKALTDGEIYVKIKAKYAQQKDGGDAFGNVEIKAVEGRVLLPDTLWMDQWVSLV